MTVNVWRVTVRHMTDLPHGEFVGRRIRQARTDRGESQQALATRAGIGIRTLTRVEQGEDVRLGTLRALAEALGLTVPELLDYESAEVEAS